MKTAQRGIYAFDDFKHSRTFLAKYVRRVIKMILETKKKHTADIKQELNPR